MTEINPNATKPASDSNETQAERWLSTEKKKQETKDKFCRAAVYFIIGVVGTILGGLCLHHALNTGDLSSKILSGIPLGAGVIGILAFIWMWGKELHQSRKDAKNHPL